MRLTLSTVSLAGLLASAMSIVPFGAVAVPIQLQNGTATFSQLINGGPFSPAQAIDGDFGDPNGWAVATSQVFDGAAAQTAVWETAPDVLAGDLTITMHFLHFNPGHLLGRFRLSVTTDDRTTFADGLHSGGDVTANWIPLTNPVVVGPTGMTFTSFLDGTILVGGTVAAQGVYEINFSTGVNSITGLRLEAIEDPSLPGGNGPGLHAANGNFLLTELTLDGALVPEPSTLMLLTLGGGGLALNGRRRKADTAHR